MHKTVVYGLCNKSTDYIIENRGILVANNWSVRLLSFQDIEVKYVHLCLYDVHTYHYQYQYMYTL